MAKKNLIECPACNAKVSFEAEACPKCGQPITHEVKEAAVKKQLQGKKNLRIGCLVILVIGALGAFLTPDKEPYDWADHHRRDAVPKCSAAIEKYAKYGYDWSSMGLEYVPRFPHASRVIPDDETVIRFRGNPRPDSLRFKNGFGVMVPMEYSCDYDTKTKMVVNVTVREK
jgi:hypothetical protein